MSSAKWIRGTVIFMFLLLTACVDGDDDGGTTDTTAPEMTLVGENSLALSAGDVYVDPGATASDNVDGNITTNIVVAGDTVDTAVVGTYTVTYDVSDAAGNSAPQLTRTVNVSDTHPPEIIQLGEDPLNLSVGDTYVDPGVFALDNVDGNITTNIVVAGDTVDTAVVGTYTVTYDVSDAAGNSAPQLTRTVNVSDASTDPDAPIPTSDVTTISLLVSSPQMPSDGSSTVTLTAVARDGDNNYVENATIEFTASSGGILPSESTTTNASGRVSATLDVGGDPTNRTITVMAVDSVTGQSASQLIEVRGTQFIFSGPPHIEVGESADLVVQLVDAGGNPITFQTITLSSSLGNIIQIPSGLTTDSAGRIAVTVLGVVAGTDVIIASTLDLNADNRTFVLNIVTADTISFYFDLPVDNPEVALGEDAVFRICLVDGTAVVAAGTGIQLSSTRGVFGSSGGAVASYSTDGVTACWDDTLASQVAGFSQVQAATSSVITAYDERHISKSIEFIATTVSLVNVQPEKSTLVRGEQTQVVAILRDSHYNLVKNRTVSFSIDADASNGNLSPPIATTNSNGEATVVYTAGMVNSGPNDVVIRAQDLDSGIFSTIALTVKNRVSHVVLGGGNSVSNYDDASFTSYALAYNAIVTDSAGQPVANQAVRISIWSHRYYKGSYYSTYIPGGGEFILFSNAPVDEYQWNVLDDGVINWGRVVACGSEDVDLNGISSFNEDINANGRLDIDEDLNGNGVLDTYEDSNQNGILDAGEDLNGNGILDLPVDVDVNANGRLDPGNIATISVNDSFGAFSINTTTDENGVANFAVIYPKSYANWLEVSLTASVIVDGTEDFARARFLLPVLASDVNEEHIPPAGYVSPFGRGYANGLIQGCTMDEI